MCKTGSRSTTERLPILPVAFLCAVHAVHIYIVSSIFSFGGILTVDLGWAPDENWAGFASGWLPSSSVCGRILSSAAWGFVGGHYGGKVVLAITSTSLLFGCIIFGFCTNIIAAVSVRFIFFGILNGWAVMVGPCAVAVAGHERQTEVLGLISAAEAGAQLIAPAVGGWTYGIVEDFPALLPSLIGCGLCLLALALLVTVRKTSFSPKEPVTEQATKVTETAESGSPPLPKSSLHCQWPIPLIIFMRFAGGCGSFAIHEAVPLWLISDNELGGRSGLWYIIYFTWLLPWLTKRFGSRGYSSVISALGLVTACCLPFSPNIPVANLLHLMCASALLSSNLLNVTFTNNACVLPEARCVTNGLAATLEAAGKAVGAMASSSLFAWTLRTWGWHGHSVVFFILAGLAMIQILCVLCLPSSVEPVTTEASTEKAKDASAVNDLNA